MHWPPLYTALIEIVMTAVQNDALALEFAAPELKADREIVLAAVRQNGLVLAYAAPELMADREIVLAASANCGWILEKVALELRADREIVLEVSIPFQVMNNLLRSGGRSGVKAPSRRSCLLIAAGCS